MLDGGRTYPSKLSDDHRQENGHGGRSGERRRRSRGPHVVARLKRPVLGGGVSRALHRRHTATGLPNFFRGRIFLQCTTPPRAKERFMPSTTATAVATATKLAGPFA